MISTENSSGKAQTHSWNTQHARVLTWDLRTTEVRRLGTAPEHMNLQCFFRLSSSWELLRRVRDYISSIRGIKWHAKIKKHVFMPGEFWENYPDRALLDCITITIRPSRPGRALSPEIILYLNNNEPRNWALIASCAPSYIYIQQGH